MNSFLFLLFVVLIFSCSDSGNNRETFIEKNSFQVEHYKELVKNSTNIFDSVFSVINKTKIIQNDNFYISTISRVFVTKDKFVIVDNYGKQVLVYSRKGSFRNSIGRLGKGPGEFNNINSIDLNIDNEILILDNRNRRISKFQINGQFVSSFRIRNGGKSILADNEDGFYIYSPITAMKPLNKNLIVHYNNEGEIDNAFCKPFFEFGLVGGNIVGDKDRNIYVTQDLYYTAQKYSADGTHISSYGIETKNHCTFRFKNVLKLPGLDELNNCTILNSLGVSNKYCLFQFTKSNDSKMFSWIDIYNLDGNILLPGVHVPNGYRFHCIGEDNLFYFVHSVENKNINEIEYFIIEYKLKEIKKP